MPNGTTTPMTGTAGAGADLERIKNMLLQQLQPRIHPAQPQPRPGYGPEETQQRGGYMMGDQGSGKAEIGAAMNNFGVFISNMVAQHKQNQVRDAAGVWGNLSRAMENAQEVVGPPPDGNPKNPEYMKKIADQMAADPWVASNLNPANPKAMKHLKNMQKAFDVNLLGEDKGDNVYREGLKQHFKIQEAFKKVKEIGGRLAGHRQQQQQRPQQTPEQMQQALSGLMQRFAGQQQITGADPKVIEQVARISEAEQAHKETLEFHKQAHLDSLAQQKASLDLRRDQMAQTFDMRKATMQESERHHKEMEDLTRQLRQIERDKANTMGDVSGLKDAVDRGMSINEITDSKSRDAVIKAYSKEGRRVPVPMDKAEQASLDDAHTQVAKIRTWQSAIKEAFTGPDGQLPNSPAQTMWQRIQYKFGKETPQSKLISDLSRERWAAIGGLVRGVRRGDILRDMVQHTPNPTIDSPKLMDAKLQALEANYSLAAAVIYKEHGLQFDPTTGENVDDEIKGYDEHLKAVKTNIENMGKPKVMPKGAAPVD